MDNVIAKSTGNSPLTANSLVHRNPMEIRDYFLRFDSEIFRRNQYIYREANSSDTLYYIEKGQVILSEVNDDGREVIKSIMRPGQIFGEQALANKFTREERARVKTETIIRTVSVQKLKSDIENDPQLGLQINKSLLHRMYDVQDRWKSQVSSVARDRIIDFILDLMKKDGKKVGYEFVVKNNLTHMEMANYLGTSRQTVTVVLNELRDKDLIYFDRKRLLIRDLDNLLLQKGA